MKRLSWLICTLVSTLAFTACESPDEMMGDDELALDEAEQALTLQILNKGSIYYDTIKSDTLNITAYDEYVPRWKYTPTSGQTVTFGLDIPTSTGGSWLCMTTSLTFPATCTKQAKSTTSTHAEFTHTFANTTAVYLFVRLGTPVLGSYAYKISTQRQKCSVVTGPAVESGITYSGIAVKDVPAGSTELATTWAPVIDGVTFTVTGRQTYIGTCSTAILSCGSGSLVCGSDFAHLATYASSCVFRNHVINDLIADPMFVPGNSWWGGSLAGACP